VSDETTFWLLIICVILGSILIFNWVVPGIEIAAVGLIPFVVGVVGLFLHHRRHMKPSDSASEENE
jgi:hypothetical protein